MESQVPTWFVSLYLGKSQFRIFFEKNVNCFIYKQEKIGIPRKSVIEKSLQNGLYNDPTVAVALVSVLKPAEERLTFFLQVGR